MTEIEFRPTKKIVVLDEHKYNSADDLFAEMITGVAPDVSITLLWVEGVVFGYVALPPESEVIVKHGIQGTIYLSVVKYAKMDKYQSEKSVGNHTIKIVKAPSPALVDLAKKLKERL